MVYYIYHSYILYYIFCKLVHVLFCPRPQIKLGTVISLQIDRAKYSLLKLEFPLHY